MSSRLFIFNNLFFHVLYDIMWTCQCVLFCSWYFESRLTIWPEWNDAEINKEKWDSSKGAEDGKSSSHNNAVNLLYKITSTQIDHYEPQRILYVNLQIYFRSVKLYSAFVCSHILKILRGKFLFLHRWECTRGSVLQTLSTRYIRSF